MAEAETCKLVTTDPNPDHYRKRCRWSAGIHTTTAKCNSPVSCRVIWISAKDLAVTTKRPDISVPIGLQAYHKYYHGGTMLNPCRE
ncbi:Hypothetical predicted protein [Pelobates cultripes]|uniref:Uncharacterized protein n=1 Tax=Pelobates cultripes TaxID=61616 RepID=A0AAD1RQH7_PELCU|nr:Hypothetical predicted protein [Pelobates cultripes]